MIQYQIHQTNIIRIVWQTVKRVTNEVWGIYGLRLIVEHLKAKVMQLDTHYNILQSLRFSSFSLLFYPAILGSEAFFSNFLWFPK